jgi:hypothetical protein
MSVSTQASMVGQIHQAQEVSSLQEEGRKRLKELAQRTECQFVRAMASVAADPEVFTHHDPVVWAIKEWTERIPNEFVGLGVGDPVGRCIVAWFDQRSMEVLRRKLPNLYISDDFREAVERAAEVVHETMWPTPQQS